MNATRYGRAPTTFRDGVRFGSRPFGDKDMPDVDLPFSRGEYAERLRGARQAMDRAGVEVLFTCDPSNMA